VQIDWQTGCSNRDRAMRFVTRFRLDQRVRTIFDVQLASQLAWRRVRTESLLSGWRVVGGLNSVPCVEGNSQVLDLKNLRTPRN
jgi:hypothetical protein